MPRRHRRDPVKFKFKFIFCSESRTSNIIVISLDILIDSPLTKHNFLLSSSTVFMFSIQIASTGPSNMTHFLSEVVEAAAWRYIVDMMPSCHSRVFGSNSPYIWPAWFNIKVEVQLQH